MSNSTASSGRSRGSDVAVPRAVIHKQILDVAESRPDAAMEAIAEEVSGATVSIVTNVLEEYGDPATALEESAHNETDAGETEYTGDDNDTGEMEGTETPEETGGENDAHDRNPTGEDDSVTQPTDTESAESETTETESAMTDHEPRSANGSDPPLELAELTPKQRETLREIYDYPTATQAELADRLGVSSATINQRVNGIDGFDWADRSPFVESLFDADRQLTGDGGSPEADETPIPDSLSDGSLADASDGVADAESDATTDSIRSADESTPGGGGEASDRSGTRADGNANREAGARSVSGESVEHLSEQIGRLAERLEALEDQPEDESATAGQVAIEPALLHKVMHACLSAEHISEDEELRILKSVLSTTPTSP